LDALTLNLGPEWWQADQARVAYRLAEEKMKLRDQDQGRTAKTARDGLKLFLSLDMNVLPSSTLEEMDKLADLVVELGSSAAQLRMFDSEDDETEEDDHQTKRRNQKKGRVVLSTFGGGECSFGGAGWEGFLKACRERGTEVSRSITISIRSITLFLLADDILMTDETQTAQIYFIPAFFLPPEKILGMDYLNGVFNWNAAWSVFPCANPDPRVRSS
jgi:glucan endo-1,3-alpha-glucosidase